VYSWLYGLQQAVSRFLVSLWLARMTLVFLLRKLEWYLSIIPDSDEESLSGTSPLISHFLLL
ncbi:hypothetical protein R7070_07005, partial [Vibrio sp. 1557]|uniref:hypothetical protein n=1 Tax=Vibrio sp. 1557 TaxID=3074561 RepID=UPI0029651604